MKCPEDRAAFAGMVVGGALGALLASVLFVCVLPSKPEPQPFRDEGWRERVRQHAGPVVLKSEGCGEARVDVARCLGCGWSERVEKR